MIKVDMPKILETLRERMDSFISFEMQQLKPNTKDDPIEDSLRFTISWALVEATIKELMDKGLYAVEKSIEESKLFDE